MNIKRSGRTLIVSAATALALSACGVDSSEETPAAPDEITFQGTALKALAQVELEDGLRVRFDEPSPGLVVLSVTRPAGDSEPESAPNVHPATSLVETYRQLAKGAADPSAIKRLADADTRANRLKARIADGTLRPPPVRPATKSPKARPEVGQDSFFLGWVPGDWFAANICGSGQWDFQNCQTDVTETGGSITAESGWAADTSYLETFILYQSPSNTRGHHILEFWDGARWNYSSFSTPVNSGYLHWFITSYPWAMGAASLHGEGGTLHLSTSATFK